MEPPTRFERVKEDYKSTILPLELQGRKINGVYPAFTGIAGLDSRQTSGIAERFAVAD